LKRHLCKFSKAQQQKHQHKGTTEASFRKL